MIGSFINPLQVLHEYLDNDEIECDNETAIKLGCLELRYPSLVGGEEFII